MAEFITVTEAAEELGVTPGTIRNWIALGIIKAVRVNPAGKYLIEPRVIQEAVDKGRIVKREEEYEE